MGKRCFVVGSSLLLLVSAGAPGPACAGHGMIWETDSQIIVEYSGDEAEAKAARATEEREERMRDQEKREKAAEAERIRRAAENHEKAIDRRRAREKEGYDD